VREKGLLCFSASIDGINIIADGSQMCSTHVLHRFSSSLLRVSILHSPSMHGCDMESFCDLSPSFFLPREIFFPKWIMWHLKRHTLSTKHEKGAKREQKGAKKGAKKANREQPYLRPGPCPTPVIERWIRTSPAASLPAHACPLLAPSYRPSALPALPALLSPVLFNLTRRVCLRVCGGTLPVRRSRPQCPTAPPASPSAASLNDHRLPGRHAPSPSTVTARCRRQRLAHPAARP
jgi:hypothetical protein